MMAWCLMCDPPGPCDDPEHDDPRAGQDFDWEPPEPNEDEMRERYLFDD